MRSVVLMQIGFEDKSVEATACKNRRACAKSFPCKVFQVRTAHLSCHLPCQGVPLHPAAGFELVPMALHARSKKAFVPGHSPCCQPAPPPFQVAANVILRLTSWSTLCCQQPNSVLASMPAGSCVCGCLLHPLTPLQMLHGLSRYSVPAYGCRTLCLCGRMTASLPSLTVLPRHRQQVLFLRSLHVSYTAQAADANVPCFALEDTLLWQCYTWSEMVAP